MEPRIQYAKTEDGVSIAFWTMGSGSPFVMIPVLPFSHVQLEWKMPAYAHWYQHHARERQLVRYDPRGAGLSQRDVSDFSIEAQLQDLAAVINRLDLPPFALWAYGRHAGPIGVTFAARFPERVTHLILFSPTLSVTPLSEVSALESMREEDWELYLKTASHVAMGWPRGDLAREMGTIMAESVTPKTYAAVETALKDLDITPVLSKVLAPTLVIARRQAPVPLDVVTSVAAGLPDARLVVLEGDSLAFLDDPEVLTAIDEFLGEGEEAAPATPSLSADIVHTILFTDVEGSTALTDRLGDAKARDLLREHERMVRDALKEHGGSEVKTMGDGFMASFSSATKALECAIALQRTFAEHNASATEPIRVRVGLNAGEPIAEDDPGGRSDLFGTAVNMAARIASKADAGEILVADVVRQLVAGKEFLFADRGETELRGFEDQVRIYEVRWDGRGS